MSKINKIASGLLFFDDFSEKTLMWTQSPSDINCISFGDEGLQIQHNDNYITYTIIEPERNEYSCVVQLDHEPFNKKDIAGVIVMSTAKDYAECQSYIATGPSEIVNGGVQTIGDLEEMVDAILDDRLDDNYVTYSVEGVEIEDESTETDIPTTGDGTSSDSSDSDTTFVDKIYKYIKFIKQNTQYRFLASTDNINWIEVGSTSFDEAGAIGFFLYSTEDQELINNSHCYFKTFALYTSKYIIIDGIDAGHEFEIYDENGYIHVRSDDTKYMPLINRSRKRSVINTTTMQTPIKNAQLRVFPHDKYKTTINRFELGEAVYGGDNFILEHDIKLFIDNQEINQLELYDLGTFYRGSYFVKLDIYNNEDYVLNDLKLKVIRYSEYYGGEEEVAIALYDESHTESELEYAKEVIIDSIVPSEGRSVYIKLIDRQIQDFYMTANSYRFKIIIE